MKKTRAFQNAKIFLHSAKAFYYSGAPYGSFGITTQKLYDTLTISLDGYETKTIPVKSDDHGKILF